MKRNFKISRRTPELFLSRLLVLTAMGIKMATMFANPPSILQGITNRLSFFIYIHCLSLLLFFKWRRPSIHSRFFSFLWERTSHTYIIAGLITYLPFLALQSIIEALIVWFALTLRGLFHLLLYYSLRFSPFNKLFCSVDELSGAKLLIVLCSIYSIHYSSCFVATFWTVTTFLIIGSGWTIFLPCHIHTKDL